MDTAVPRKIAKDAEPWYDFSAALGKLSSFAAIEGERRQTREEDRLRKEADKRRAEARERMRRTREAARFAAMAIAPTANEDDAA